MIQAFMTGIVFAKMTRPKHRTQTLLFSKNAVICQRDGLLCLMFRVGDMRKSHIIGANVRAQLIRPRKTKEGEILNQFQTELSIIADGCDGNIFFIWPMTIVHIIDSSSPFYHLSASDLLQEKFEVVVMLEGEILDNILKLTYIIVTENFFCILERTECSWNNFLCLGTIESTGQSTQARSSYLATEILWGHKFEPIVNYNKDRQGYEVNYSMFDNTQLVDTPLCSGVELSEFHKLNNINISKLIHLDDDNMWKNYWFAHQIFKLIRRRITQGSIYGDSIYKYLTKWNFWESLKKKCHSISISR